MLRFWWHSGIIAVDLAVRRAGGAMIWHRACAPAHLPLPWLRAENVRQADVYIRPARGASWPLLLLDDVEVARALRIARKYAALAVQTSPDGGCHLWLRLARPLDEHQRYLAQRWLIRRVNADPCSVSGEHLGRLAGTRNWKRAGVWVNVLNPDPAPRPPWDPAPAFAQSSPPPLRRTPTQPRLPSQHATDNSASGQEWGWVCGALDAGLDPQIVYRRLLERAATRRGSDAERYARHTLQRALQRRS
jgi:DNA-binding transcriptional MocR family regulator